MNEVINDPHFAQPTAVSTSLLGSMLTQVYGWMSLGLGITFGIAFLLSTMLETNLAVRQFVLGSYPFIFIGQLLIVLVLSLLWRQMNAIISAGLFVFYSATMGVFLSTIFFAYSLGSIISVLGATVAIFIVMAVFGLVTKRDLTGWGTLAIFGLFGLIIATFFNFFLAFISPTTSNAASWILTYVGIGIFLILIAYDSQKIKALAYEAEMSGNGVSRYAIQGALMLYLDFINIFIRLISIFGKRR